MRGDDVSDVDDSRSEEDMWDGAPGAWDGIDAWDFEAAEEGTVVAFPMQVRGLADLPGDRWAPAFEELVASEPQP
jgi:hypothetical protein